MDKILIAMAGLAAGAVTTATVSRSVTYDPVLVSYSASAGGDMVLQVQFRKPDGKSIGSRELRVPAVAGDPVRDGDGQQVAAQAPAALRNARAAFETQVNALLDAAAAAGKLDP